MMSSSFRLFLIVATVAKVAETYCPQQNKTDEPEFTQKLGRIDYVRLSHSIAILCCAQGYDNITWYRIENGIWKNFPPLPHGDDNTPKLEEDGQILRIFDAEMTDNTTYRCDVAGKTKEIQHITDLIVIECDPLARGPIPTFPLPENQTIYKYGGNITLPCTGYFGCGNSGSIRLAFWSVNRISPEKVSPRYSVQKFHNKEQTILQETLTISSVQKEDTKRTFFCILATPQKTVGQTVMQINIFKEDVPGIPWLKIGLIIGGVVTFVVVIAIIVVCLRHLYGPQIRLFCSSRIAFLRPRYIDNENYIYNVFIYHAEDDENAALSIKEKLTDRDYKVFITADIEGNQNVINTFSEKTGKSAMVLFLYSEALRKDNLANVLLQAFIYERKGKDILFLEVTDYKPKEIMEWAKHAKDVDKIEERENDKGNKRNTGEITDDLRFWRVLPRLKVPSNVAKERKKSYFWCSLQNKIPKFADKRKIADKQKIKDKYLSAEENILENNRESEPLIPINGNKNADELCPYIDEEICNVVYMENEQRPHAIDNETTEVSDVSKEEAANRVYCNKVKANSENVNLITSSDENNDTFQDLNAVGNRSENAEVYHKQEKKILADTSSEQSSSNINSNTQCNLKASVIEDPNVGAVLVNGNENVTSVNNESRFRKKDFSGAALNCADNEGNKNRKRDIPSNQSSFEVNVKASQGSLCQNTLENSVEDSNGNGNCNKTNNQGNAKLNLIIKPLPVVRGSVSSSPESGYITSPSEREYSPGTFLPQIQEQTEKPLEVITSNAIQKEETAA